MFFLSYLCSLLTDNWQHSQLLWRWTQDFRHCAHLQCASHYLFKCFTHVSRCIYHRAAHRWFPGNFGWQSKKGKWLGRTLSFFNFLFRASIHFMRLWIVSLSQSTRKKTKEKKRKIDAIFHFPTFVIILLLLGYGGVLVCIIIPVYYLVHYLLSILRFRYGF